MVDMGKRRCPECDGPIALNSSMQAHCLRCDATADTHDWGLPEHTR